VTEIDDECSVAVLPEHLLRHVSLSVPSSLSEAVRKNQIRNILAVKWLITLSNRFCLEVIDANAVRLLLIHKSTFRSHHGMDITNKTQISVLDSLLTPSTFYS
jgi:hypothetical protein